MAQQPRVQTRLPDVSPANPKAFEFLKYGEIPVSKYTGVPSIAIPVYTIKAAGLDIPISLSYHANGFRITEESGWTGLGWSLNVGGSIVQVVNGYDDFGWFRSRDNELQGMVNAPNSPISNAIINSCTNVNFLVSANINAGICMQQLPTGVLNFNETSPMVTGLKDLSPDIFKFSILGYSGEFMLDWKNNVFKCLTDSKVKVECPGYTDDGSGDIHPVMFIITMADGNIFYFNLKEETAIAANIKEGSDAGTMTDGLTHLIGEKNSRVYQVSSIITNGGDVIGFDYVQTSLINNLPSISKWDDTYTFRDGGKACPCAAPAHDISFIYPAGNGSNINYSKQSYSYLSAINFADGKILFNSTADRTDLIGSRKLNSIEVRDKQNALVKTFNLAYDYFAANQAGNNADGYLNHIGYYNTGKQASEINTRLRLLSFTEVGTPSYQFQYDPELLPKKTSYAADIWGYYNGKTANVDPYPNVNMLGITSSWVGLNNNTNSSLNYTRAGVLKKIIYPTGGSSTFDYELNSFNNYQVPDDVNNTVTPVFLSDRNNGETSAQIFSSDVPSRLYAGTLNLNTSGPNVSSTNGESAYIRLTILKKTAANIALTNQFSTFWPMYYTTPVGQMNQHASDVISDTKILQLNLLPNNQGYETFKLLNNYSLAIDADKIYIMQAYLADSFGPQTNASLQAGASVSISYIKNTAHALSNGAGLRIKSIKNEAPNTLPVIKTYAYSGGKLMSPLTYMNKAEFEYEYYEIVARNEDGTPIMGYADKIVTKTSVNSSNYYSPSTNASGKFVGYDQVEESNGTLDISGNIVANANGKVLDTYTNSPDIGLMDPLLGVPTNFNFIYPAHKTAIENGLPLTTQVFDKNATLLQSTTNVYYPTTTSCVYGRVSGYAGQLSVHPSATSDDICVRSLFSVGFYPITYNQTLKSSSSRIDYANSGNLSTSTAYEYDSNNQQNKISETNSTQETVTTYLKYPYDFTEYLSMAVSGNVYTPIIEMRKEISKSGSAARPIQTSRNYFTGIGGGQIPFIYALTKTTKTKGAGTAEDEVVVDLYSTGNTPDRLKPLQFHNRFGAPSTIIWGYNGQYPVAKVEGADYNTVKALINQTMLDNAQTYTDQQIRTELNKIRTGLTGTTKVITYTYAPLVGITSMTDQKGQITFYEYDSLKRLTNTKNNDGNIINHIDYHFQGQ